MVDVVQVTPNFKSDLYSIPLSLTTFRCDCPGSLVSLFLGPPDFGENFGKLQKDYHNYVYESVYFGVQKHALLGRALQARSPVNRRVLVHLAKTQLGIEHVESH